MDGAKWHTDRKTAEVLLTALAKVTPEVIATLQTSELERVISLLTTTSATCGAERQRR